MNFFIKSGDFEQELDAESSLEAAENCCQNQNLASVIAVFKILENKKRSKAEYFLTENLKNNKPKFKIVG